MSSHPDADAFVGAILRNPADLTTRLVFADWLEEAGGPSNVAWAHYIRLNAEIAGHLARGTWRPGLEEEAASHAPHIRSVLTIPAAALVAHPNAVRQLLPLSQVEVTLGGSEIPRTVIEYVPESVARENFVLPLHVRSQSLLFAMIDPHDRDTRQKLQFILNKEIHAVRAARDDLLAAINRHYGPTEVEVFDSLLVQFTDTSVSAWGPHAAGDAPVERLVVAIVSECIAMGGQRVQILPHEDYVEVRFFIQQEWVVRDQFPVRLLAPLVDRVAHLAGMTHDLAVSGAAGGEFRFDYHGAVYTVRAAIAGTPFGPQIDLDISDYFEVV
jgi:uncharacterized protein (TIGR02996 family)